MTKLTAAQIATVAAGAGFRDAGLVWAVAVALAESSGDPQAVNINSDSARSRDRGLWQINSKYHPEVTDAAAFNPKTAAAAAYKISAGGTNWRPWSTYPGAATTYIPQARFGIAQASGSVTGPLIPGLATGNVGKAGDLGDVLTNPAALGRGLRESGAVSDVLGNITNPLDGVLTIASLMVKAGAWIADPHNWVRIMFVSGGAIGALLALRMIAEAGGAGGLAAAPAKAVKAAAGGATMIATGGTSKVAQIAKKAAA